jgi:hypothetical protein
MTKEKFVNKGVFGIHHVTAITSDPQRNIDFMLIIWDLSLSENTLLQVQCELDLNIIEHSMKMQNKTKH